MFPFKEKYLLSFIISDNAPRSYTNNILRKRAIYARGEFLYSQCDDIEADSVIYMYFTRPLGERVESSKID